MTVAERLAAVTERIASAARTAGREPGSVTLVAVSKGQPASAVRDALAAGQTRFGENYAQDLVAKAAAVPGGEWHFIGPVQRNKVAMLVPVVALWHAVDRPAVAAAIGSRQPGAQILVEVNVAGEASKHGCTPHAAPALVDSARDAGLDPRGLMTIPPAGRDPRPYFEALRELGERLELPELSMGMSGDFDTAVAEGATIVRIGEAIFGARTARPRLQR